MKKIKTYISSAIVTLFVSAPALSGVVVVVHPDNPNVLDELQVKNIYLGKMHTFPDGSEVLPIDQDAGAAREAFIKEVLKKDEASLNSYWARMLFSSKGKPPKVINNASEMKNLIASNKNAIGYIDSSEVDNSVKVILTVE